MTTLRSPQSAAQRPALPFAPECQPAPRAGTPAGWRGHGRQGVTPLPQRTSRDLPFALAAAGFPGLSSDGERGVVARASAERELGRVGLAYLRAERSAGVLPLEQLTALAELLRPLDPARSLLVAVELSGPVSLALQLVDEQERPLAYEPAMREALAQHVTLRSLWLREQLGAYVGAGLICLDEPFLDAIGSPFSPLDEAEGLELLAQTLADLAPPRGLCVPGSPNWPAVLALPADVVFFDAYEHGAALIQAASAVAGFLDRGGVLAWGVVPNEQAALTQERVETLARRFESTVEFLAAAGGITPERIRAAALISTSGNLANLPPASAAQAAALCGEVSAHLRARYQLG